MSLIDIALLTSLFIALVAWMWPNAPRRSNLLWAFGGLATALALYEVAIGRWQAWLLLIIAAFVLTVLIVRKAKGFQTGPEFVPHIAGGIMVVLTLIGAAPLYLFPVDVWPEPEGPHAVGVRVFDLTDDSRKGVMGAGPGEPRRLLLRVWYPAESTDGLSPRPYFTKEERDITARGLMKTFGFPEFLNDHQALVETASYGGAPILAAAKDLPVIFYSHGYWSHLGQNTALMEHLASHGYVVFAVQHTGDSAPALFPDGSVGPTTAQFRLPGGDDPEIPQSLSARYQDYLDNWKKDLKENSRFRVESADNWTLDRQFIQRELVAGRAPDAIQPILAAVDFSRTGQMGMSFGGTTSGDVCQQDPTCVAAVNLDGGNNHLSNLNRDHRAPFLMMHSDMLFYQSPADIEAGRYVAWNDWSYESHATAGTRDDIIRLTVHDVLHLGYSDSLLMTRQPAAAPTFGGIDGPTMIGIQNDFTLGFFDKYLRNKANDFPDAQFLKYKEDVRRHPTGYVRDWWLSEGAKKFAGATDDIRKLK